MKLSPASTLLITAVAVVLSAAQGDRLLCESGPDPTPAATTSAPTTSPAPTTPAPTPTPAPTVIEGSLQLRDTATGRGVGWDPVQDNCYDFASCLGAPMTGGQIEAGAYGSDLYVFYFQSLNCDKNDRWAFQKADVAVNRTAGGMNHSSISLGTFPPPSTYGQYVQLCPAQR